MNFPAVGFPILICTIPLAALFVCMAILVEGFSVRRGIFSVLLGILCVAPILLLLEFFDSFPSAKSLAGIFFRSVVISGLIEESAKALTMISIPYRKNTLKTFFCYAVLTGASLGCFETLIYSVGYEKFEFRILTAVVLHASCAGLSGIFVWSAKGGRAKIFCFVLAVVLHGIYNYFAGFRRGSFFFWFSFVVVLISVVECRIRYRSAMEN
jgi:RsiW-degrading membrane proteinase PrsW (M82 family)